MKIGYVRVEAFEPFDLFNEWRVVPKAHIPDLVRETELRLEFRSARRPNR